MIDLNCSNIVNFAMLAHITYFYYDGAVSFVILVQTYFHCISIVNFCYAIIDKLLCRYKYFIWISCYAKANFSSTPKLVLFCTSKGKLFAPDQ